jgi:hypothetical protein
MQDLARYGRITFDPFSSELPSRFPDPRWIDTIDGLFASFYEKHYETRGAGGETFIAFLENFMSSAIREAYRSGEIDRAQRMLDSLNERFGTGASVAGNPKFALPLDVFVKKEVYDEYAFQPHLAPSEAVAALRYGFRVGVGRNQPEIYRQALSFVDDVIAYFKGNEYYDFETKFGTGRMRDLIGTLERTKEIAFLQLMTDPTIQLQEKATLWSQIDKYDPELRLKVYDRMAPLLQRQFDQHALSQKYEFAQLFGAPPGLERYRQQLAAERLERERQQEEARSRDPFEQR